MLNHWLIPQGSKVDARISCQGIGKEVLDGLPSDEVLSSNSMGSIR